MKKKHMDNAFRSFFECIIKLTFSLSPSLSLFLHLNLKPYLLTVHKL